MCKLFLALIALGLVFCFETVSAQEEPNCSIEAYVIDIDPNGLNVRRQPSVKSKVLVTLKQKPNTDLDFIVVYVTGYSNGWVKIARAEDMDGEGLFDDIGWVSAKMVATSTKGDNGNYNKPSTLYAQANSKKKIGTIPSETEVMIIGFTCGWVKVSSQGKIGWIRTRDICGNPVTTCS